MACGTPVLAEANPMMEELIELALTALWRRNQKARFRQLTIES